MEANSALATDDNRAEANRIRGQLTGDALRLVNLEAGLRVKATNALHRANARLIEAGMKPVSIEGE
jgi:hypothetical protein